MMGIMMNIRNIYILFLFQRIMHGNLNSQLLNDILSDKNTDIKI